jgi:hypothetical protein
VWIHADPVTGSKQETSQSGEKSLMIGNRAEYEPLGQAVRTWPPSEEEPPTNPPPPVRDSLFPEWQCSLPRDLLPTHCALKMIEDIKSVWLGVISINNEGNPTKLLDTPLPTANRTDAGMAYAARATMSSAIASTAKDKDDDDDCDWDKDGRPDCKVRIKDEAPLIDMSATGIDASGATVIKHPDRWLSKKVEIETFHQQARRFLDQNTACEGFINELLKKLPLKLEGDIRFFVGEMERTGTLRRALTTTRSVKNRSCPVSRFTRTIRKE